MANFNKVILAGNLTRDPQLTYTPANVAVCKFGMAINRQFTDREGNRRDETCFVDVTAFAKQAETLNQYMTKGRPLLVEGRLQFSQWTGQDGQKRSKLEVVVEGFQFLGGKPADGSRAESGPASARTGGPSYESPAATDMDMEDSYAPRPGGDVPPF